MRDRESIRQKVQDGLQRLVDSDGGPSPEKIASTIVVSYPTVKNWLAGRRTPSEPVIRHIEQTFKWKIL